ncbi:hypothetical protein PMAYCL1PPCAC_21796, partial [Pristionchus mayeri]
RFYAFLFKHKPRFFKIRNAPSYYSTFANHKFFEIFLKQVNWSKTYDCAFALLDTPTAILEKNQFQPCKEVIDTIAGFHTLEHRSIILNSDWIPDLLGKWIEKRKLECLKIGVDNEQMNVNFDKFPHLEFHPRGGLPFSNGVTSDVVIDKRKNFIRDLHRQ